MESDTMELLRLMLAHLRPRLQGRDEEWQALERKQQELMASFRETHGGDVPLLEEGPGDGGRLGWRGRTGLRRPLLSGAANGPGPGEAELSAGGIGAAPECA